MYTNNFLLELTHRFNKTKVKNDYEIDIVRTGIKKNPFQIVMLTEEGHKHKYAGTIKECCNFLLDLIPVK